MHLVFLNQYYPPDVAPTGVMLETLTGQLAAEGHRVTVVCAGGGYAGGRAVAHEAGDEEKRKLGQDAPATAWGGTPQPLGFTGVRVIRIGASRFGRGSFAGKLLDYASFYAGAAWRLLTLEPRPDRIVALTTPPYLSLLARFFSKLRGGDHAHWVMDLYPDVMVAHGMLRKGCRVERVLAALTRWAWSGRRCAAMVTLGPDMAERVAQSSDREVNWVPLWGGSRDDASDSDEAAALALRQQRGWGAEELVVMYSGNMGLGHRFEEILDIASQISVRPELVPCPLRFTFHGGGKRRREIEEFILRNPTARVELHDYAAAGELTAHLCSADLHLVSLAPEWTGTMVPSKLQGIFQAGRPVLFLGDTRSSLGTWVAESGGGWVAAAGDCDAILDCLTAAADPLERSSRGDQAAEFARKHFDRTANASRLAMHFTSPARC